MTMNLPPPLTYVPNHVDLALATLSAWALKDPNIVAWVSVSADRVQKLENWLALYLQLLTLDGAADLDPTGTVNVWLDRIGLLVGETRGGAINSVYAQRLRAAILRNKCNGTPEEIIACVTALLSPNVLNVRLTNTPPAAYVIGVLVGTALTTAEEVILRSFVLDCTAGGVGVDGIAWYTAPVFGFDPDHPSWVEGWGDGVDPSVGAGWANFIYP